ncbi:polysaccharide lyase family 1 protein [Geopyxis carbonaria]|nr:polysaccharide lyase family 1 protein [Geopyxis carbonaria]
MTSRCMLFFFALFVCLLPQASQCIPLSIDRRPFGYGARATGGAAGNTTVTVTSMPALRAALLLPSPKTILISGTLHGADVGNASLATCDIYIATSTVPQYNFTEYILSLNSTYTALVAAAAAAKTSFSGHANASEYLTLLRRQNGWRPLAANSQKRWVAVEVPSNTTLVGLPGATLSGVNIKLSSVSNVVIRNLHIIPPADCFPAPESWPANWNARYDAISVVTATTLWLDGLTLQSHPNASLALESLGFDGWLVDRTDGLLDIEDGSDAITLSHSVIANHGKSLLFGGGNKEADRDLGKMRITLWGNRFEASRSRNPLMRFGTYEIVNCVFVARNDKAPLWGDGGQGDPPTEVDAKPFQYHFGVYNQSSVVTQGNVFRQTGLYPQDLSRVFAYSDLTRADIPAKYCAREEKAWGSMFNGEPVDLGEIQRKTMEYNIAAANGKLVEGGLFSETFIKANAWADAQGGWDAVLQNLDRIEEITCGDSQNVTDEELEEEAEEKKENNTDNNKVNGPSDTTNVSDRG